MNSLLYEYFAVKMLITKINTQDGEKYLSKEINTTEFYGFFPLFKIHF